MEILFGILGLVVIFIAVILIRTLTFKPLPQPKILDDSADFERDESIKALQELIKCKTVSYYDSSLEDDNEFKKLISLLPSLYPNVFKVCEFNQLPDRALLFKWAGKDKGKPTVLMAHYDVVPVEEQSWEKPPFDAIIEDGILWGRGSLDTKVTFNGVLFAANTLIKEGYVPENDIYFAF